MSNARATKAWVTIAMASVAPSDRVGERIVGHMLPAVGRWLGTSARFSR